MEEILTALQSLRAPIQQGEYDLHRLVMDCLLQAGIDCRHEVALAPRCRIDLMCGRTGIEIKRGRPDRARLLLQLERYARCGDVDALILICEGTVNVPRTVCGKPVRLVCLNRLWGIAL